MNTVTFLSDFGSSSAYVAQMKGVLYSLFSEVNIIDISHDIPPQDVTAGAFVLKTTIPYMPTGSVHIGVVDPGVGTDRRGIVIVTNNHVFIGPDNGLFLPAAQLFGLFRVYEITNETLFQHPVSSTFHGRDIFTSVAGHILKGIPFESIGPEIHDYVTLSFPKPYFETNKFACEVLFVDDFGNLITSIDGNTFFRQISMDQKLFIRVGEQRIPTVFAKSYGFVSKNELLITIGSHGYVEISVNQGRADERLNLRKKDKLEIEYYPYDII